MGNVPCARRLPGRYGAVIAVLVLTGCGSDLPTIETEQLRIIASPAANADSPVAVDLVFALDADALGTVSALPAAQWFKERDQLRLAFPSALRIVSFEVVPHHSVSHEVTDDEEDAVGAFVFANFASPGTHRARVDQLEELTIRLGETAFTVEPSGG